MNIESAYRWLIKNYWAFSAGMLILLFLGAVVMPGHFVQLWLAWLVIGLPASAILIIGSLKRAKEIDPAPGEHLRYSESMVSGRSMRSTFTRLGGANRCLNVAVTESAIHVRPFGPFQFGGDIADLFHKIPIRDILSCEVRGSKVEITWTRPEENGEIVLALADPRAFLKALGREDSSLEAPQKPAQLNWPFTR